MYISINNNNNNNLDFTNHKKHKDK
jgi:hypothetical protein